MTTTTFHDDDDDCDQGHSLFHFYKDRHSRDDDEILQVERVVEIIDGKLDREGRGWATISSPRARNASRRRARNARYEFVQYATVDSKDAHDTPKIAPFAARAESSVIDDEEMSQDTQLIDEPKDPQKRLEVSALPGGREGWSGKPHLYANDVLKTKKFTPIPVQFHRRRRVPIAFTYFAFYFNKRLARSHSFNGFPVQRRDETRPASRRKDHGKIKSFVGTAVYRGVALKKFLKKACGGIIPGCEHLEFIGADIYFKYARLFKDFILLTSDLWQERKHVHYAMSVPWRKLRMNKEVFFAREMDGEPLPKIHGYPDRLVFTGNIGARTCKGVFRVNSCAELSMARTEARISLLCAAGKQNVKWNNGFSIQNMPVSGAIIKLLNKEIIVHDGKIRLQGWSYSGGGNWVQRVEVSPDGGHIWYAVPEENLTEKVSLSPWRLWVIDVPVDAEGWVEFCVRTWDSSNNTEPTWHLHVISLCHRIKLYSVNRSRPETSKRLQALEQQGDNIMNLTRPPEFSLGTEEYLKAYCAHRGEPFS
ncbi:hypothetical protein SCHPADRAFT_894055 [Schizopora paradoxa]|uniref:Molybdopterin binding oxidoreductase n=1 Tax=Schizopora paradoxa TaxID=27342 RepID=A0A0H2R8R5_9AGAM|nr:hypothetical protein SCHPADRAFT_894055 [Schizopora paradoxa]